VQFYLTVVSTMQFLLSRD